ncbi:MAG: sialate O-acetylesterase [Bacteroidia bacterium]
MKKIFSPLFMFFLIPVLGIAQVSVTTYPAHLQLYPRDLVSNEATVTADGTVDLSGISYSELRMKVYRDNVLQATETAVLGAGTGVVPFSITYDITAELNNYKFELYGFDGAETLIETADSVVAGDVYVITGQSNAEAESYDGSASGESNSYIRVYGRSVYFSNVIDKLDWFVGQGDGNRLSDGNTGQWGLKMANSLVTNESIPVAIFNGAHGGKPITFFERNDADHDDHSTNYGKLLNRLLRTNSDQKIRGFFWFQGENDASDGQTENYYKAHFGEIFNDWDDDLLVEKYYVVQIREVQFYNIDKALPIQEAHRVFADSLANVEVVSTSSLQQHTDNVHFAYTNGFEKLGNLAYKLLDRDLFGAPDVNISSPNIVSASISNTNEITLYTEKASDAITADAGIESHFRLEGSVETITAVAISGSQIVLTTSGDPTSASGISYSPPKGGVGSVVNTNGAGLISFYDFPVGTLPIELLSFNGELVNKSIALNWITVSEKSNSHFDVQRSGDGQTWQSLGSVAGAGNSDERLSYQFVDINPVIGINRYRLKQVDFDGNFSLSPIVELSFFSQTSQAKAYPNPSNGNFSILYNLEPGNEVELNILNPMGQIVHHSQVLTNEFGVLEMDLGDRLVPGHYIVQIKARNGQSAISKILIQ